MGNSIGTGMRQITKGRLGDLTFQVNPTVISGGGGGYSWADITSPGMLKPIKVRGAGIAKTWSFELYVNEWMFDRKINVQDFIDKLDAMKDQGDPVDLVIGAKVYHVVIIDAPVTSQAFNPDLSVREATIAIQLSEFE
jgi:hypothetical protein